MLIKQLAFRGNPYKIAYVDTIPQHPSWYSFDDESSVRDRDWDIRPGDLVLDVGAAYGSYALTALASGASHVWAWSPQGRPGEASEADFLRESIKLNGWEDRCTVYENGVFVKDGWLNTMTQQFWDRDPGPSDDVILVSTLDTWSSVHSPDRVDWMKLDVEGAETEVLWGAKELISKFRPKIQVENHLFKRATIEQEVRELLITGRFGHPYREVSTHRYHSVSHSLYLPL